jgi:CRP/FNR family cyclic AMP-dependent transcriptional regulator
VDIDQIVFGYIANEELFPDKSVIIEEGSKGDWIYIVLEGQVKVKKRTPKGMVTLDTLKRGDIFGEMVLLEQRMGARTASVVAEGPTKVGVLDTERIVNDYESLSPQLKGLMRSLILRLKETTHRVSVMAAEAALF